MKSFLLFLFIGVLVTAHDAYKWEQAVPPGNGCMQEECTEGKWPMALVPIPAFENKLWMTGQKRVWSSADGIHWTSHEKKDWEERISMAMVFFNNKLWMYGGMKYQSRVFQNDTWSSNDGITWVQVSDHAPWMQRKGHCMITYNNRLWLFGGATSVDKDIVPDKFLNDVWVSEDGVNWKEVIREAPWMPMDNPNVVVFNNSLWLLGGQGHGEIWNSIDGKTWKQVTAEAPWKARWDQGVSVFDNKIWVYGGREKNPRIAMNDVWFSPDGKQWNLQQEHAPWTPRSAVHSTIFQNKLWIFAGKHTGSKDNWNKDIWVMKGQ